MNSSKFAPSLTFFANLSLADLEAGFFFNSSAEGVMAFLFNNSKNISVFFNPGKYLETFSSSE